MAPSPADVQRPPGNGGTAEAGRYLRVQEAPTPLSLSVKETRSSKLKPVCKYSQLSPTAQLVKNPPATRETWVLSLGWDDLLEKGKATHTGILASRIPWTV